MNNTEETMAIAAIVHEGKGSADAPLLEFIQQLQSEGLTIRGLIPGPQSDPTNCATRTVLDLDQGTVYPIGQNLGKDSKACSLDAGALLVAGVVLRRAAETSADLVVVNRFGVLEADGGGFSAEMLDLITKGYPVLTVVSPPYLDAFRAFTGGMAAELPPEKNAIMHWFKKRRLAATTATGTPQT